jgi:putative acetyltransferase
VDPAHQRIGVGSALVRAGLAGCPRHGWRAVFLVGDPNFYARFGFEPAAARRFVYGVALYEPAFQFVELTAGTLEGCAGRVRFHPAFAEAEGD